MAGSVEHFSSTLPSLCMGKVLPFVVVADLTPDRCAHWDGAVLSFSEGVDRSKAPRGDKIEKLWLTYHGNIFNPARVKVHAMQAEMPKKYWRNLPETTLTPTLAGSSGAN
jgi:uracil-DNA glycosylase